MAIFFKKTWGFEVPAWPLAFSKKGNMEKARERLKEGDLVVIIGTMDDPTPLDEQGRLVGILQPTEETINIEGFDGIDRDDLDRNDRRFFYPNDQFRWPYALGYSRAWKFRDKPRLEDIALEKNYPHYTVGNYKQSNADLVQFSDEEAKIIERLAKDEVDLPRLTAKAAAGLAKKEVDSQPPTTKAKDKPARKTSKSPSFAAPPPQTKQSASEMHQGETYTYALKIERAKQESFKIGRSMNWEERMRYFNHHSMPALGGLRYMPCMHHLWDEANQADQMEKEVLIRLQKYRHPDNHEIVAGISKSKLISIWEDVIKKIRSS